MTARSRGGSEPGGAACLVFPGIDDLRRALAAGPDGLAAAVVGAVVPGERTSADGAWGLVLTPDSDALALADALREAAIPARARSSLPDGCHDEDLDALAARFAGPPEHSAEAPAPGPHGGPRLLLVRGGLPALKEATSLVLEFREGDAPIEVAALDWDSDGPPAFLLRLPARPPAYPRLRWADDPTRTALLAPIAGDGRTLWLPEGWVFKAPELLPYLDPGDRLASPAGWARLPSGLRFRRFVEVAAVSPAVALRAVAAAPAPDDAFAGLTVRVRLAATAPHHRAVAPFALDRASLEAELRALSERRLDLEARADRLEHLLEPAPRIWRFSGDAREAVARMVTGWPDRVLARFRLAALAEEPEAPPDLWLIPEGMRPDQDPPAEVAARGQAFALDLAAARLPGPPLRLFLPWGQRVQPVLAWGDTRSLRLGLGLAEASGETELVVVGREGLRLVARALPEAAFVPLPQAATLLNRVLRTRAVVSTREAAVEGAEEAARKALERFRARLLESREAYQAQARTFLSALEEEAASLQRRLRGGDEARAKARAAAEEAEAARQAVESAGAASARRLVDHGRAVVAALEALEAQSAREDGEIGALARRLSEAVERRQHAAATAGEEEERALRALEVRAHPIAREVLDRLEGLPAALPARAEALASVLERAARRLREAGRA